jgi:hypothetical protein
MAAGRKCHAINGGMWRAFPSFKVHKYEECIQKMSTSKQPLYLFTSTADKAVMACKEPKKKPKFTGWKGLKGMKFKVRVFGIRRA